VLTQASFIQGVSARGSRFQREREEYRMVGLGFEAKSIKSIRENGPFWGGKNGLLAGLKSLFGGGGRGGVAGI
jgi:hypothetical protein